MDYFGWNFSSELIPNYPIEKYIPLLFMKPDIIFYIGEIFGILAHNFCWMTSTKYIPEVTAISDSWRMS